MRSVSLLPLTRSTILAALRDCYHPVLGANIVDLGFVRSIEVALDSTAPGSGITGVPPRYRLGIELLCTSHEAVEDHVSDQIAAVVQNRLAAFPEVSRTDLRTLLDHPWTTDRIAPELRERIQLAIASNHRSHDLIQIQTASKAPR